MRFLNLLAVGLVLIAPSVSQAQTPWKWNVVSDKMTDQRWAPAYCLVPGTTQALIAGGYSYDDGGCIASADLFDEKTQQFIPLFSRLNTPRDFGTASPLPNGDILIAGGFNDVFGSLNIAEIYNPSTQQFTLVDQHMLSPRELHTATVLKDGKVLIVGGLDLWKRHTQNTAELYDPATSTFAPTNGHMTDDRFGQAACLLADGRVLIVGGTSVLFGRGGYAHVLASAEIYNPRTGTFTQTAGAMTIGRDRPTATLLANGRVLIAAGQGPSGASIGYAELFDPVITTFTKAAPQITDRMAHTSATLADGRVLLAGGWSAPLNSTTPSVEEYDPASGTFLACPPLPFATHDAAVIVFPDGEVLVAGGKSLDSHATSTTEDRGAWAIPK
jgi:hypothetical protein